MVGVFADQNVGQEARARHAALDRTRWGLRLHDCIAFGAGHLGAYMANHFESHRLEFQHLRNVVTEMFERAAAVGAFLLARCDDLRFARQVRGKLPPRFGSAGRRRCIGVFGHNAGHLRIGGFEFLDPQLQLLDLLSPLFTAPAKLQAAQLENQEFERFDREPVRKQLCVFRGELLVLCGELLVFR